MAPRGQRPCSPCSSLALFSLVASRARDAVVKTAEPAPLPSAGLPYGPAVRRAWQPGARCWAWKDDAGVGGAPGRARMARAEAWGGGLRALWTGVGTGWPRVAGARRRQACTGCGCAGGVPGEGRGFGRLPWLEAGSRPLRCHKGVRLRWLEPKEGGWALRTWWAEGQGPRKWSALSPWGMGASECQEMGPGCAV